MPPTREFLGPRQGDILGNLLSMRTALPWNRAFGGKTVVAPDAGALPVHTLPGGLRLTLLSPTWKELAALDAAWIQGAFRQGRIPGEAPATLGYWPAGLRQLAESPFTRDRSVANGSSIAVLAEYQGKRCLLAGDAFADTLVASLQRLPGTRERVAVDAFKLPHHGSQANVSAELLQRVQCSRYLISTDGGVFGHPDEEAISRILLHAGERVELRFNYDSQTTRKWNRSEPPPGMPVKEYKAEYPKEVEGGLLTEL
jgi:hypothetical protein